ncbi:hypothetical protein [Dictyobacter kobayashii]|uniref:Uncharacterized protein n=1 Tax=Dictyobacter kobayashii TaxID=2014872 RepID=A0A402AS10_9CHLR|nr:hypothetical protein [Dictyobacter kobayashii]GCE21890.1 hypothetical protein KDK_56900 [Dictyobacter kobayashii]
MEDSKFSPPSTSTAEERRQPIVLISQLLNQTANLQHVDEVFLWLSRSMVQYLNISVVQFWASQLDTQGKSHLILRAAANQLLSPTHPFYTNRQIEIAIERFLQKKEHALSLPIEQIFPSTLVQLLAQYNTHFFSGYFLQHTTFLPAPQKTASIVYVPTPLTMVVSFFTAEPLTKDQERAIHFILGQSIRILVNQQFLLEARPSTGNTDAMRVLNKNQALSLTHIIPQRTHNMEHVQADNPFSTASTIKDKKARRFYSSIDGSRSVAELARMQELTSKEVRFVLSFLLQDRRIQLYTPTGELIDPAPFMPTLL